MEMEEDCIYSMGMNRYSYCFNASEPVYIIRNMSNGQNDDTSLEEPCDPKFVSFSLDDD